MRLNQASDFALRILMLLAKNKEPMTVEEIATRLRLVKSHVMKIVAKLVKAQILQSQRGRSGGIVLGKPASAISVGDVVRIIEADFAIVECMQSGTCQCVFTPKCKLKGVIHNAQMAFLSVLDGQTLDGIAEPLAKA